MGLQPSASKTDLLLQCARPWDSEVEINREPPRYEARYGSAFHLGMAQRASGFTPSDEAYASYLYKYDCPDGEVETLALKAHVEESWDLLEKWLAGENPWETKFVIEGVEKSLAYDPAARTDRPCRFEEEGHHYDLEQGEIGLTYDILFRGVINNVEVWGVLDHKTGKWEDYSTPSRIAQLRTLALATDAEIVAVLDSVPGGFPAIYAELWDSHSSHLREDHRKALIRAMSRMGDGSMRPGPECKFCPARGDCPARGVEILTNAAALVDVASAQLVKPPPQGLTLSEQVEMAGRLHLFLAEFDRLAKLGRAELRATVEEALKLGVECIRPDGKTVKFVNKTSERLSKKSILLALGAEKGEELLEYLRKVGALEEKTVPELRAV